MCELCDGRTEQELFETMRARIDAHQWTLQGVEAGPHSAGWVYTIGLIGSHGNPELVLSGDDVDLDGYPVEFGAVHASYLEHGLCACWTGYYNEIGTAPGPLRVLQVVPPLTEWCDHCDRKRRCLATPGARGFGGGLNRAARRAQSRRERRR